MCKKLELQPVFAAGFDGKNHTKHPETQTTTYDLTFEKEKVATVTIGKTLTVEWYRTEGKLWLYTLLAELPRVVTFFGKPMPLTIELLLQELGLRVELEGLIGKHTVVQTPDAPEQWILLDKYTPEVHDFVRDMWPGARILNIEEGF